MKKSTLFISAALTAFILATLAGVMTAYKNMPVAAQAAPAVTETLPTSAPELPTAVAVAAPTQVSPMDAAGVASQFLNQQDVYSVETAVLNGVNVYKVTFSSADIVYVGLDGTVISTAKIQPVVVSQPQPTEKPHKKPANNNNGGDDDDHGEHD